MNTSTVLLFGSFDGNDQVNTFMLSARIGVPLRTGDDLVNISSIEPSVANVRSNQPVDSLFRIRLQGSSPDDVNNVLGALRKELRDASDIIFGLEGSDYIAVVKPLFSACPDVPMEEVEDSAGFIHAYRMTLDISVHHKPYLRSATDTLYDAVSVTLPAVVTLDDMIGDGDAPLDMLADFGALNVNRFFAGRYPDASATIADFVREAVDLTWDHGTDTTDAAGYPDGTGNTILSSTAAESVALIDVTDLEPGEYLVLARCKQASGGASTVYLTTHLGGLLTAAVDIDTTTLSVFTLGVITLPVRARRGAINDVVAVRLISDTSHAVACNWVAFIPVSFGGVVGYRSTGYANALRWEDEMLYADDAGALGESFGGVQVCGNGGVLVMVAEQATPAPTTDADLTLSYEPHWEQLPSDGTSVPGPSM